MLTRCICTIGCACVQGEWRWNNMFPFLFMIVSLCIYHVIDCPDGYFGVACGNQCNCRDLCSTINGVCSTQNCYEGWSGVDCQIGMWNESICISNCKWVTVMAVLIAEYTACWYNRYNGVLNHLNVSWRNLFPTKKFCQWYFSHWIDFM